MKRRKKEKCQLIEERKAFLLFTSFKKMRKKGTFQCEIQNIPLKNNQDFCALLRKRWN